MFGRGNRVIRSFWPRVNPASRDLFIALDPDAQQTHATRWTRQSDGGVVDALETCIYSNKQGILLLEVCGGI